MKLTNENGMPDKLFRALQNAKYSGEGEERFASVTELIAPAFQTHLKRLHWHEVTQEATDFGWIFDGNAFHHYMQHLLENESEVLTEERLSTEIDGKRITGGMDIYTGEDKHLTDYKATSVYTVIYDDGEKRGDYEAQVNIYAYMLRQLGFPVESVSVILKLRDWNRMEWIKKPSKYPASMYIEWNLRLWDTQMIEDYLRLRISRHEEARAGKALDCLPREKWESPTKYAVWKEGNKVASRVFETREPAQAMCDDKGPKHSIEVRPGVRRRCSGYCPVNKWCDSYQQYKTEQGTGDGE